MKIQKTIKLNNEEVEEAIFKYVASIFSEVTPDNTYVHFQCFHDDGSGNLEVEAVCTIDDLEQE